MKKKGLIITLSVVLVLVIAVFGVLLTMGKPDTQKGEKDITVTIVYEDKTQKEIEISTNAETLGAALLEEELISEEEYNAGFYSTIDGVRADYSLDKAWWQFSQDGVMATVGANELPIADGDNFEIIHTPA